MLKNVTSTQATEETTSRKEITSRLDRRNVSGLILAADAQKLSGPDP